MFEHEIKQAPLEDNQGGGGGDPEVSVSEADCGELNAKLGGVGIPNGFPAGLGNLGPGLKAWMDSTTFYITIDGVTYSCPLSQLDYWTVNMIISLFEQYVQKRARST